MAGILLVGVVAWLGIVVAVVYTVHTYRSTDGEPRRRSPSWLDMEN